MRVKELVSFIEARERHRRIKERLITFYDATYLDPIISKYRFCNVRRNNDRVTKWIFTEYMGFFKSHPDLWFALVVARLFNLPESLAPARKYVLPFRPEEFMHAMHARKSRGLKNFNAAYIVSTNGVAMDKVEYLVTEVLEPLWAKRVAIRASLKGATLAEAHELLMRQNGLASFMAAQVLADLKYAEPELWSDFHTFAASGPGSKRGLHRIMGRAFTAPLREPQFREELSELRDAVNKQLRWEEPLTAQDLQNCLCEYDKYERARLGEGTPKQIYTPHEEKK